MAYSVPASGRAVTSFSERSHSFARPCDAVAANTNWRPSGEIASDAGSVVGGVGICSRISAAMGEVPNGAPRHTTHAPAATTMTAALAVRQ